MPAPRKIDRLPPEIREWLKVELVAEGFGNYVAVTERLNARLEERGEEMRVQKTAVHAFGQEYKEFVRLQEATGAWAEGWVAENSVADEAKRHSVLFQMVTALAFKSMEGRMTRAADEIDPKELHYIGRMLKDIIQSSGIREKLVADVRAEYAAKLNAAEASGGIDAVAAEAARRIMGFA